MLSVEFPTPPWHIMTTLYCVSLPHFSLNFDLVTPCLALQRLHPLDSGGSRAIHGLDIPIYTTCLTSCIWTTVSGSTWWLILRTQYQNQRSGMETAFLVVCLGNSLTSGCGQLTVTLHVHKPLVAQFEL